MRYMIFLIATFFTALGIAQTTPGNHALIITVSGYERSPLPGVKIDRENAQRIALKLGVELSNIHHISEQEFTVAQFAQHIELLNRRVNTGDKLFIYFSGHGTRYFNTNTKNCEEGLVTQDMRVISNSAFKSALKPIAAKTSKTLILLDSCHSGGVASYATGARSVLAEFSPKFSDEASHQECTRAVNTRRFEDMKGADLDTGNNNLTLLAAAQKNEVAWDTSRGGAMTVALESCLNGKAIDLDKSGAISMQEIAICTQKILDSQFDAAQLQHIELAGNVNLVPNFDIKPPLPTPIASLANPVSLNHTTTTIGTTSTATQQTSAITPTASSNAPIYDPQAILRDIYHQRDDRWAMQINASKTELKIGHDKLQLSLQSSREGYPYVFYKGTGSNNIYLLYPNALASHEKIKAGTALNIPGLDWEITANGPAGKNQILVIISDAQRDFSAFELPAHLVNSPFTSFSTQQDPIKLFQASVLSANFKSDQCKSGSRDLAIAKACSNAYGAAMLEITEKN